MKAIILGDEITSLSGITDGTKFIISDGTNADYFYGTGSGSGENEIKNAALASVPDGSYYYFTLEAYTGDDVDNAYYIKITNADDEGYPYGSDGESNYYLNAVLGYSEHVISGIKTGWGSNQKDALWYVTYDNEKGFSFQNVYRADNGGKSWLAIGNDFVTSQQYLKLYSEPVIVTLNFDAYGKATTSKEDLSATDGLSYNSETGVVTSDGTAGELKLEFAEPVDLKYLNYFNVKRSGTDGIIDRLYFYDEDDTEINNWGYTKFDNTWRHPGCDDNATNAFLNHKPVKKLVWKAVANPENEGKTLTINSIEWTLKTISCAKAGETQLKTLTWNKIDDSGTVTPNWNMNGTSDTYYGDYSGNPTHYVDLTAYSELRVYCKSNSDGFRAFFINADASATNAVNTSAATWHATEKYYSLDLSSVTKWNKAGTDGIVALKSIKSDPWSVTTTGQNVTDIEVYKTPVANAPQYTLTGSGMQLAETVAALADANVTSVDATGVIGNTTNSVAGQTLLESANPNCLFLGTTGNGGLANTQNVITSGTCTNLVLVDNYPFKSPSNFTANTASYTTTINTTAQVGTLCLPFAATIPSGVKAWTLNYTSGDEATANKVTTGTIGANTPVLLNGSGEKTFTGANVAIDADAANTSGALTGVFEQGYVPVNSYILQNQSGNIGFYKVATANTNVIKPFRAYLTVEGVGPSRLSIDFIENDEPTGVDAALMNNEEMNNEVYNLCGQRVEKAAKGLYIKNGKKVIMK